MTTNSSNKVKYGCDAETSRKKNSLSSIKGKCLIDRKYSKTLHEIQEFLKSKSFLDKGEKKIQLSFYIMMTKLVWKKGTMKIFNKFFVIIIFCGTPNTRFMLN